MPAGIIRGVLSRVGLAATVTPEITSMPQCKPIFVWTTFITRMLPRFQGTFQVKLPKGS